MTPISNSNTISIAQPTGAKGSPDSSLDQAAFLKLMSAQLQSQDPFKPMDQNQMVAQMAQFSQVAGTAEMNVTLRDIATELARHGALLESLQPAAPVTPVSPEPSA
jgi:flagellar basal-body rod modification protein FlgD